MLTVVVIIAILLIVWACITVYRTAEVNELHKIRAAFEDKRHILAEHYRHLEDNKSKEAIEEEGEIKGLDDAIEITKELEHLIF